MSQQKFCTNANSLLEEIKTLKLAFESAYNKAISSGDEEDIKVARDLKDSLKNKMDELQEAVHNLHYLDDGRRPSWRVEEKNNYGEVEKINLKNSITIIQVLPDGRIVSGGRDNTIYIWTKDSNGSWTQEKVGEHGRSVSTLQALPDGRIVSGGDDKTIYIWTKASNGSWTKEKVGEQGDSVYTLQVLPDGRIVSGGFDNTIRIFDGTKVKE